MNIAMRQFNPEPLFGEDYVKLRSFLVAQDSHNYSFGRWDWMVTHGYLNKTGLPKIGLWEEAGQLVAVATYDCSLGNAYLLVKNGYEFLYEDMFLYAKYALQEDGKTSILIADGNLLLQGIATRYGYVATSKSEKDAIYPIDGTPITYDLPEGFSVTSMADTYDVFQYGRVLWKGFNHEANGEGPFQFSEEDQPEWDRGFLRPNVNLDLKIAVVAPNGDFVSYCGMWYDAGCESALVEPVATDPAYRRMGLGRAAVLEGIRRCGKLGAKRAFVGSSQQFYYSIGFRPYATSSWWVDAKTLKDNNA